VIYDSTEPNANLVQVEWIYAKKLTRSQVPLHEWNKDWRDHKIEIASGRVQVLTTGQGQGGRRPLLFG